MFTDRIIRTAHFPHWGNVQGWLAMSEETQKWKMKCVHTNPGGDQLILFLFLLLLSNRITRAWIQVQVWKIFFSFVPSKKRTVCSESVESFAFSANANVLVLPTHFPRTHFFFPRQLPFSRNDAVSFSLALAAYLGTQAVRNSLSRQSVGTASSPFSRGSQIEN